MSIEIIPQDIRERYQIEERRHACAVLFQDCKSEFDDIIGCLRQFELLRSEIAEKGGRKSRIASRFDEFLAYRGWREKSTKVERVVGGETVRSETHKVDFCKGKVAIEVEWNNKDPFFSRDLATFRLLHDLGVISVGIMITRCDDLQDIFDSLGIGKDGQPIGKKYGSSTTHWGKLLPRVEAMEAGSCPLLLVGIKKDCYRDDG